MSKSMVDYLRKRRITKVTRSIAMSEANENGIRNKAEVARNLLGSNSGIDSDTQLASRLSYLYYYMKAKYVNNALFSKVTHSEKRDEFWARVVEACKKADVSPEKYMKAQFSYFHKTFGTVPNVNQLATSGAVTRAQEFAGKVDGFIVGNNVPIEDNLGAVFSRCERQLRDMCKAQSVDRAEFYRRFVCSGVITFPVEFLNADPVYEEVVNEPR